MIASDLCRACGADRLRVFYEVSDIPVESTVLLDSREAALAFPRMDLQLVICEVCGFIANSLFQEPTQVPESAYETSQAFSPHFSRYLRGLCDGLIERHGLREKTIIEIGSGSGEFLRAICELGDNLGLGFDPLTPPNQQARQDNRVTLVRELYGGQDLGTLGDFFACRHTLEHVAHPRAFIQMIRGSASARPGARIFFEVPDVTRILSENAFWDLYYEHCSYFSLGSLARLFRSCDHQILELDRVYDDQYLTIVATSGPEPRAAPLPGEDDLEEVLASVERFSRNVSQEVKRWRQKLDDLSAQGKRMAVWGSGSKAAGFLATLRVHDEIEYVVDINERKQGKFQAGTGQEIVAPGALRSYQPDAVILMNPIYRNEITIELDRMGLTPQVLSV